MLMLPRICIICFFMTLSIGYTCYPADRHKQTPQHPTYHPGVYPHHWSQLTFHSLIRRLNPEWHEHDFIQWCNAMHDGILHTFYGEVENASDPSELFICMSNAIVAATKSPHLYKAWQSYISKTHFMRDFQNICITYLPHFHLHRHNTLLTNMYKMTSYVSPQFLQAWQQHWCHYTNSSAFSHEKKLDIALPRSIYLMSHWPKHITSTFLSTWLDMSTPYISYFSHQGRANSIYALAKIGKQPNAAWYQAWRDQTLSWIHKHTSQELCNIIWALEKLHITPDAAWLQQWLNQTRNIMANFTTQDISMSIHALAQLHITHLDDAWYDAWMKHSLRHMHRIQTRHLSISIYALAILNKQPYETWIQHWKHHFFKRMPTCNLQDLTIAMHALAKLDIQPDQSWLERWEYYSRRQMHTFIPQSLVLSICAFAKLQRTPSDAWFQSWQQYTMQCMHMFSPRDLSQSVWALAYIQKHPNEAWLQSWENYSRKHMHEHSSHDLSESIWALAYLEHYPEEKWYQAWENAMFSQMETCNTQHLATGIWALERHKRLPSDWWYTRWTSCLHQRIQECNAHDIVNIVSPLARLRLQPEMSLFVHVKERIQQYLDTFDNQTLLRLLYGLTLMHVTGNDELQYHIQLLVNSLIQRVEPETITQTQAWQKLCWIFRYFGHSMPHQDIPLHEQAADTSSLEREVITTLQDIPDLSEQPQYEYSINPLKTFVDCAFPKHHLALEVDGNTHFLGDQFLYRPQDLLKRKLLEKHGWHVIRIPYAAWRTQKDHIAYLRGLLKPYGLCEKQ